MADEASGKRRKPGARLIRDALRIPSRADTESGPGTQAPASDVVQRRVTEFTGRTSADTVTSAIPSIRGLDLHALNLHAGYTDEDMRYALDWKISELPVEDQYPDSMGRMGRVLVELGVKDVVVAEYECWDQTFTERLGVGLYALGARAVIEDLLSANCGNDKDGDSPPPEGPTPDPSAADRSSQKAIAPNRPCRLVFNPHLPLSPEPSGIQLTKEDTCPDVVRFYHGSHHEGYGSVLSFQTTGVVRTGPKSFYTCQMASYWTSSSSFAIWWAARRQVSRDAMRYALDESPSRRSLSPRDNIPRELSSVSCLVVACDAEKEVLWDPDWDWVVFETEEEESEVWEPPPYTLAETDQYQGL